MEKMALVVENRKVGPGILRLVLEAPGVSGAACPGQFVHVLCGEGPAPLLRRPFSISRVDRESGRLVIIYQVVGSGTGWLSARATGDLVNILGPLGKGFPLYTLCRAPGPGGGEEAGKGQRSDGWTGQVKVEGADVDRHSAHPRPPIMLLVGGGMGTAPLLFLAQEILAGPCTGDGGTGRATDQQLLALTGARTAAALAGLEELRELGLEVEVTTEDGSTGQKGVVTDLLASHLARGFQGPGKIVICACGPIPMLARVQQLSRRYEVTAYLSLEAGMACGLGACRGCAVPVHSQEDRATGIQAAYKMVCQDGPVFPAEEVIFGEGG